MFKVIKKILQKKSVEQVISRTTETDQMKAERDVFAEILATESLLKKLGYPREWEMQVLAREMCLIDAIAEHDVFDNWVQGDKSRIPMRAQIARELVSQVVPVDDDHIKIGNGGCKPRVPVQSDRKAIILLGLPASGKSTVAQKMSEKMGAFIVDSDFAKRKFPEIAFPNGAAWTHAESNDVVFKDPAGPYSACLGLGHNMIIPKIGSSPKSILELKDYLESLQFSVSLGLVWLEPKKAMQRAIGRYQSSKRYIPLHVIEGYGDKPIYVFNELIEKHKWDGYVHLSSDVNKGDEYPVMKQSKNCIWL